MMQMTRLTAAPSSSSTFTSLPTTPSSPPRYVRGQGKEKREDLERGGCVHVFEKAKKRFVPVLFFCFSGMALTYPSLFPSFSSSSSSHVGELHDAHLPLQHQREWRHLPRHPQGPVEPRPHSLQGMGVLHKLDPLPPSLPPSLPPFLLWSHFISSVLFAGLQRTGEAPSLSRHIHTHSPLPPSLPPSLVVGPPLHLLPPDGPQPRRPPGARDRPALPHGQGKARRHRPRVDGQVRFGERWREGGREVLWVGGCVYPTEESKNLQKERSRNVYYL